MFRGIAISFAFAVTAGSVLAQAQLRQVFPGAFEYVPGEVLVKFRQGVNVQQMAQFANAYGGRVVVSRAGNGIMKLYVSPRANVIGMADLMKRNPAIEFAEPNGIVHAADYPNDPFYGTNQWALPKINWLAAVNLYKGKSTTIIAIIDSGIQLSHPDLAAKIMAGKDFVNNDLVADDDYHHGTHVAGIAAAITNNAVGVAGVCPNAVLMPVKVLDASGNGTWENVAAGIKYASDNGAHVINMSLGSLGAPPASILTNLNIAVNAGCVICCAAGNQNTSSKFYPAAYDQCIAAGATSPSDARWASSNYNSGGNQWVDVAAPGETIYSTFLPSTYQNDTGTSMASPHVSGLAALLYGVLTEPSGTTPRSTAVAVRVRQLIEDNCDNVGTWVLKGRINAGKSITESLKSILSGNIVLQAHVAPATVPVTLQLFDPGTGNLVETKVISLNAAGDFTVTFASAGTYDVRVSTGTSFLARRVPNVALSRVSPASGFSVQLPNGDATRNNVVDIYDLNVVLIKWTGTGQEDMTGDGIVDLSDLNLVLTNFSGISDP